MKYVEPWLPLPVVVSSSPGYRSQKALANAVAQCDVTTNPRYTPRDLTGDGKRETFCNIFLWDVTRALGAEVPHWVDNHGNPCAVGKGRELSANLTVEWMHVYGASTGWLACTLPEGCYYASRGQPVVLLWRNHTGIGHVALLLPSHPEDPMIAQAGKTCFAHGPMAKGFGRLMPEIWAHA